MRQNCISPGRIGTTGSTWPVDRDDLVLAQLGVLEEKEPFRQAFQHGKQPLRSVDHEAA